jgi:hypothetical protein
VGLVTVVAGRQAMSLVRFRFSFFAGVGLVTVVAGRQARALVWFRLYFFRRRGLSHCGGGPIGKGVDLVSPLYLWSAWDQSLLWRADRQIRWSRLASVPLVRVDSITVVAGR